MLGMLDDFFEGAPIPEDKILQQLMLLGAMYVEESEIIQAIRENVQEDDLAENLVQGFCALDMNMEDISEEEVRMILQDSWDVKSKEELEKTLDSLMRGLSHKQSAELFRYLQTAPANLEAFAEVTKYGHNYRDFDDANFKQYCSIVQDFFTKLGPAGILGWDWGRYVHVMRLGYLAGYVSQEESWALLHKLKDPVTQTFKNWNDFAQSYIRGRMLWQGEVGETEEACLRLLSDKCSPWLRMGWIGN